MPILFRANHSSGIPLYLQLVEQVKHAVEMGALSSGEQLPTIRKVAVDLIVNPNTVARAYRELEYAGLIEVRHGAGAFVSVSAAGPSKILRRAQAVTRAAVARLTSLGLTDEAIRRLLENEVSRLRTVGAREKTRG